MSSLGRVRPLLFEHAAHDKQRFVLDGRHVEFPDGLRTGDLTHTIHRFPGKFVPQVARELLRLIGATRECQIADPFCGSGTSLVEASILGVRTIGVDLDPLAVFISGAKTMTLSEQQLAEIREYWSVPIGTENYDDLAELVPNLDHWFRRDVAEQLAFIKKRSLDLQDDKQRLLSLVVLSSIIRRVSNADDQTQKTYVSGTLRKVPPTPRSLFPRFLDKAMRGVEIYSKLKNAPVVLQRADARTWRSPVDLDGVVTSPPYIDSIDYIYNQMLEYYWLYDVLGLSSPDEIRALRREPLGFRRTDTEVGLERLWRESRAAADILAPVLTEIGRRSEKEAENVIGFFVDFVQHLCTIRRYMRLGSVYGLVIGESFVRGVTIPTPKVLKELFTAAGFQEIGSCSYLIKRHYMKFPRRSNSGKIKVDHVCCFRRC